MEEGYDWHGVLRQESFFCPLVRQLVLLIVHRIDGRVRATNRHMVICDSDHCTPLQHDATAKLGPCPGSLSSRYCSGSRTRQKRFRANSARSAWPRFVSFKNLTKTHTYSPPLLLPVYLSVPAAVSGFIGGCSCCGCHAPLSCVWHAMICYPLEISCVRRVIICFPRCYFLSGEMEHVVFAHLGACCAA